MQRSRLDEPPHRLAVPDQRTELDVASVRVRRSGSLPEPWNFGKREICRLFANNVVVTPHLATVLKLTGDADVTRRAIVPLSYTVSCQLSLRPVCYNMFF